MDESQVEGLEPLMVFIDTAVVRVAMSMVSLYLEIPLLLNMSGHLPVGTVNVQLIQVTLALWVPTISVMEMEIIFGVIVLVVSPPAPSVVVSAVPPGSTPVSLREVMKTY